MNERDLVLWLKGYLDCKLEHQRQGLNSQEVDNIRKKINRVLMTEEYFIPKCSG